MSTAKVWSCLKIYKPLEAWKLYIAYGTEQAILTTSENYPGKNDYHGHGTGGSGSPVSPDAAQNQQNAIDYLNANKPDKPSVQAHSINKQLKDANEKATELVLEIVRQGANYLGTLRNTLDRVAPGWKDNRLVWGEFSRIYRQKHQGKNPQK